MSQHTAPLPSHEPVPNDPAPPFAPSHRGRRTAVTVLIGATMLLSGIAIGQGVAHSAGTPSASGTSVATGGAAAVPSPAPVVPAPLPAPTPEPAPAPPAPATYGPGTLVVGTDLPAGTYKTDGTRNGGNGDSCYWARLSGLSGTSDEIITNGLPEGPTTLKIKPTDKGLETSCTWTKIG